MGGQARLVCSMLACVCVGSPLTTLQARASTRAISPTRSVSAPSPTPAESEGESPQAAAKALYDEGRKAYRLGKFEQAVQKWEQAYAISDNPLLLYNIALAYKGKYGISTDIADLRQAKAVLQNFITLARADPQLELDDAPERLAELEAMIEQAESRQRTQTVPPPVLEPEEATPKPPTTQLRPPQDDPGASLKLGGAISMGVGGAFLLAGAVSGAYFGIQGRAFRSDIDRLRPLEQEACMNVTFPPDTGGDPLDYAGTDGEGLNAAQIDCVNAAVRLDTARDNLDKANLGMGLGLGLGLGLGVAAITAGAVAYVRGHRRSRSNDVALGRHRLRWSPLHLAGPGHNERSWGLTISGRF